MKRNVHFGYVAILMAGLCPIVASAQRPSGQQADRSDSAETQTASVDTTSTTGEQEAPSPQYVGSLNGSGLIAIDDSGDRHGLMSLTTGGGWDSNPSNTSTASSAGVYSLSPYLGFKGSAPKSQYIAQYQATILGYMTDLYARQTLHRASGMFVITPSERWKWELNAGGSYGPNGTRLLSAPQSVAVGDIPGTSASSSASYLNGADNITYVAGSVNASYRRSERDTITASVSNAYSRTSGLNQQGGIASLKVSYTRDVSQTLGLSGYAQGGRYYGDLQYESYGAGAGIRWQPRERTYVSLSMGPQITNCTCNSAHTGVTYSISFGTRITNKSQMYFLTDHLPTVSFLGPSLWQRSTSGGFQYRITPIGVISADAGYISSDTLLTAGSYRGMSWGVNYGFHLRHGIAVSYSYRGYDTDTSGVNTKRNLVQASITWTYHEGQIFQTSY